MQSACQISAYAHYARTPVLQLKQRTDDISTHLILNLGGTKMLVVTHARVLQLFCKGFQSIQALMRNDGGLSSFPRSLLLTDTQEACNLNPIKWWSFCFNGAPAVCRERLSQPKSRAPFPSAAPVSRSSRALLASPTVALKRPSAHASASTTPTSSSSLPNSCTRSGARRASIAAWLEDTRHEAESLQAAVR